MNDSTSSRPTRWTSVLHPDRRGPDVTGGINDSTPLAVEPEITAEITGGDTQIAMAGTITLDASASRDLDVPPGESSSRL